MNQSLTTKYRPKSFDEIVGHRQIIKSLKNVLKKNLSQSFIFTGIPGTGKTSLARIIASVVGCNSPIEIDGATNTGVDDMRNVMSVLGYKPLNDEKTVIIVDEAHLLSKQAITSILKSVEEPNKSTFWILCTTNIEKIPKALQTRCQLYNLNPLSEDDLAELILSVCEAEHISMPDDILMLLIDESNGSPRQALSYLATVSNCKTVAEARTLINSVSENLTVLDLARYLATERSLSWKKLQKFASDLRDENNESIRLCVVNYINAVLLSCKDERDVARYLTILSAFKGTFNQSEKIAPILLAFGDIIYG